MATLATNALNERAKVDPATKDRATKAVPAKDRTVLVRGLSRFLEALRNPEGW